MPLGTILPLFLRDHVHLALVLDEFLGSAGIVTLEDVLEKLVGQIQDEFDTEPSRLRQLSEGEFLVAGSHSLRDLRRVFGLNVENAEVITIGGYVVATLGRLPRNGDEVRIDDYVVSVTQSNGRRIDELRS